MKRNLPIKEGLLERTRLTKMFNEGLEYSLFTVLAGPGYGKTQMAANTLVDHKAHLLWLQITKLDNLSSRFWQDLVEASAKEMPHLADKMKSMEFPDTLPGMDTFLRIFAGTVYLDKQVIWVIDDIDLLENPHIFYFFEMLIEAELENFCLILMTNGKTVIDKINGLTQNKFSMTSDDLRFTEQETAELFHMHNIKLNDDELIEIEKYTDGWALALHLMVLQYSEKNSGSDIKSMKADISLNTVYDLFKQKFFFRYPPEIQKLLVKLAHLEWFTPDLMADVYEGDDQDEIRELDDNVFLSLSRYRQKYYFSKLYRMFLLDNSYLIDEEEKRRMLSTAGDHYTSQNYLSEAIKTYCRCGEYGKMLNVIAVLLGTFYGITDEHTRFILQHIGVLSKEEYQRYPLAAYLEARVFLNSLELGKAEQKLLDLEQRLSGQEDAESRSLLGEVYALLGALHMMRNQEDFGEYYEKACPYIPEGTTFTAPKMLMVGNNHSFCMADNRTGAKERMERATHYAVQWMTKVYNGGMAGSEYLFSAEAAFLSYQFDEARQYAYHSIYKARENEQHDVICNAHCILARIALMQGDYSEVWRELEAIIDYAGKYDNVVIKEIRDTLLAWFYIRVDDCQQIPRWIVSITEQSKTMLSNSRAQVIYGMYLIHIGEFDKLIAFLEHQTVLYLADGIFTGRITVLIMRAIGYQAVGDMDKAIESLWEAYEMTYQNDLPTLFIEAGKHMRRLLAATKKQDKYQFDSKWIDLVNSRAIVYTKKLSAVRNAYQKSKNGNNQETFHLSKREKDILLSLSQGLTREEIASFHSISINTVKSTITNIYNKFGAVNRADAIYIAATKGLLD